MLSSLPLRLSLCFGGAQCLSSAQAKVQPQDECTSAVSIDVEEKLYEEAMKMGITCITISQRLSLPAFHKTELKLGEVSPATFLWSKSHPAANLPCCAAPKDGPTGYVKRHITETTNQMASEI